MIMGYKNYKRTKEGLSGCIYSDQRSNSKRRGHKLPDYELADLRAWLLKQPNYEKLYKDWVDSDYDVALRPSCDRLNDDAPYTLDNLQLITWRQNRNKMHRGVINGQNERHTKPVMQLTIEGIIVDEYHSARAAMRATKINNCNISACCHGRLPTAGGFVWCLQ